MSSVITLTVKSSLKHREANLPKEAQQEFHLMSPSTHAVQHSTAYLIYAHQETTVLFRAAQTTVKNPILSSGLSLSDEFSFPVLVNFSSFH